MTADAGFDVNPTRLRSAAPQFDAAADHLADAGTALHTALAAEGSCWGGDEAGQAFARSYLPHAEATTRAIGTVVEALRAIRVSLDESANTWENTDLGAAGTFGNAGTGAGADRGGGQR